MNMSGVGGSAAMTDMAGCSSSVKANSNASINSGATTGEAVSVDKSRPPVKTGNVGKKVNISI